MAMMSDATITTIVLSCNSLHVGHETFCESSSHDSLKYSLIFLIVLFARVAGIEPTTNPPEADYSASLLRLLFINSLPFPLLKKLSLFIAIERVACSSL